MTLQRQNNGFVTFFPEVHIQKQFSNNIYMSIRLIPVQTKVQFKILQLFVVAVDISC